MADGTKVSSLPALAQQLIAADYIPLVHNGSTYKYAPFNYLVKNSGNEDIAGVKNFTANPTVNGSAVWNSGNDGTGSGLDADLLDGMHAITSGIGVNVTINNVSDCNSVDGNGVFFNTEASAINTPVPGQYFSGIQFYIANNSAYKIQIGCAGTDSTYYFSRTCSGGAWGSWASIWNSGNDGAGSGIETDLVPSGTPSSSSASGTQGMIRYDANYVYICVATNTWKRSALSSF